MSRQVKAEDVEPKKVVWLWRDRIPVGMMTVVAGKPDQGKGLVCAHMAADISRKGGHVLYSAAEDDHGMMTRPRLEAAGANLSNITLWRFGLPSQINELVDAVVKNDVDMLVIDPFNAHLTGGVSRFSDSIRRVTQPLSELAEATGVSVVITEHALKKVAKDAHPLAAIGGNSSGLPAACRMGYIFGVDPDDDDRRVMCNVKHNICQERPALAFQVDTEVLDIVGEIPSLVVEGETSFDARRLLVVTGDGKPGRKPDKRADAAEWLASHMAVTLGGQPVPAGQIMEDAKQVAMAAKTVRRAADDMGIIRNPPGGGRNCTWDLPPDLKKAMGVQA